MISGPIPSPVDLCNSLPCFAEVFRVPGLVQQLPSPPPWVFSPMISLFSAASSPYWGQSYSNFMCPGSHVANLSLSMIVLVYALLMGWVCVQLPPGMASVSVLCTERPQGHGGVTAFSSSSFYLPPYPPFLLLLPQGLSSGSSLAIHFDHFWGFQTICFNQIWHICYSLSLQVFFF